LLLSLIGLVPIIFRVLFDNLFASATLP
jgi:hypothetical protein